MVHSGFSVLVSDYSWVDVGCGYIFVVSYLVNIFVCNIPFFVFFLHVL